MIARFASMKTVILKNNKDLTPDGWKALLSNLGPTVEEFGLADCKLDDAKAI